MHTIQNGLPKSEPYRELVRLRTGTEHTGMKLGHYYSKWLRQLHLILTSGILDEVDQQKWLRLTQSKHFLYPVC